jgi:hypothetical protein
VKIRTVSLLSFAALGFQAASASAYTFGQQPLNDVYYAAAHYNQCPQYLNTDQLAKMMMTPTWWEIVGAFGYPPSPMALSRYDNRPTFYAPGGDAYRRAFWHAGIGMWQLDDQLAGKNTGINLSTEKFSSLQSAKYEASTMASALADTMSASYCRRQSTYDVFAPFCACSTGACGSNTTNCDNTYADLLGQTVSPNYLVDRYGGGKSRACVLTGQTVPFECIYINVEQLAEGPPQTLWWDSTSPSVSTNPLALPFYVYYLHFGGASHEARYWMKDDTQFDRDFLAKRVLGKSSRDPSYLTWVSNAGTTAYALCDVTAEKGACPGNTVSVLATLDGTYWSGPVTYSVSGPSSFTGTQTQMYSLMPPGSYTVLYKSGGPPGALLGGINPQTSQFLQTRGAISWTFEFTTDFGPHCSASTGIASRSTASAGCGGGDPALSVTLAGNGSGSVISNPVGINCPGTCTTSFATGTQLLLSPNPATGSIFGGWSGDSACANGSVTMDANHSCTATFTATSAAYSLTVSTSGSGTVTSSDGGINCGSACSYVYVGGTTVTLAATAASGWSFSSWSGNCSGGTVLQVAMTSNQNCTATFVQTPATTPVTTTGSATDISATSATLNGTINPEGFAANAFFEYGPDPNLGNATSGIPYGPANYSFYPYAQTVTGLACATNYRFRAVGVGQGGEYRASNSYFTTAACPPAPCYILTLTKNGDGAVPTATPPNSDGCPVGQYHGGARVTLTALAGSGNIITGWGDTDNNQSTASVNTVTMPGFNWLAFVNYEHICYHLSLGFTGQGSTPVATNPVYYCPPGYFPWGYEVDASSASPATGWQIGGWSGTEYNYSQLDHNYILMPQQNSTALVQYIPIQVPLDLNKYGDGTGTVTSDVPGINCGQTCSTTYPYGTHVTLTATPAVGSIFAGWGGGACNGGSATVTSYTVCSATFVRRTTKFFTLPPCRVLDTRDPNDPNGPAIASGSYRQPMLVGKCGIPANVQSVSLNITIVNPAADGFLSLFPGQSGDSPSTSTINFRQGQVRANNQVVALNSDGSLMVFCAMAAPGTVDYIIDVNGYFE